MQKKLLIGGVAGLAAGVLYTAIFWAPPLGVPSLFFTPLPLFIAGLGWGIVPIAVAAASGAIIVVIVGGAGFAANFAAALAAPAILLVYLALTPREKPGDEKSDEDEWPSAGRLLAALTFIAAGFLCGAALASAGEPGGLRGAANGVLLDVFGGREALEEILKESDTTLTADEYLGFLSAIFPAAAAISFVAQLALNAGLAQRILAQRGHALRPSPSLRRLTLPFSLDVAFAAAAALAILPNPLSFLAGSLAGLFLLPYFLLGLVVVHVISTGWPSRTLMLGAFYLALVVLSALTLIVAVLGLLEACFGLRRRYGAT
jgi:hypothetical protein